MRVLFVHTIGKQKYGGGERWVVNAAAGLKQAGHEVIVAGWENSLLLSHAEQNGIETVPFNVFSDISIYHAIRFARFIWRRKIDIIICKGRDLAVCGLAAKLSTHPPVIVRVGSPIRSNVRKHIFLARKFASGVITNTQTIKDTYLKSNALKEDFVQIIYNGVSVDEQVESHNFNAPYPGKTILLSIGRTVAGKGFYFLINALAMLKNKYPELLVYVIGKGKEKLHLERYAREKGVADMIEFAGYIDQPASYIKGCAMMLHVSLYEGMPNAPMEAMAYGKPVIMTNVNGAGELTENGKHALLIPPSDPAAIAHAIEAALQDPDKMQQMAERSMHYVRNKFTMQSMIDKLDALLTQKLEESKTTRTSP